MLKKLLLFLALSANVALAYDPTGVPNNRVGVHILDPDEISQAAKLVNSSGGDWGYVTIPIRSNDRDRDKWLKFFQEARRLHVIPIIRLATFPVDSMWVEPNVGDLVDFANFLKDMPWPTQNRYIILFNEPNHASEWGQTVNPYAYANLLVSAKNIFKERSADFFLLSAGLDMSVPNSPTSMDALQFYRAMTFWQPLWASALNGLAVHAYPNPGYSSSVYSMTRYGIRSYRHEPQAATLPLFITETGWIGQPNLYPTAFKEIWTDQNIVAVTPFILSAGAGEFAKFSLVNSPAYSGIISLPKITGSPLLANVTLSPANPAQNDPPVSGTQMSKLGKLLSGWVNRTPKLSVGQATINIEIADTEDKRRQGLSNRQSLPDGTGMLFIFSHPDRHSFWMKDMSFPLDFIWISEGRVNQLSTNIPATLPQMTITPDRPVDQVLEVTAGFIDKYGIKVGDEVRRR